jgi:hypothetical protein
MYTCVFCIWVWGIFSYFKYVWISRYAYIYTVIFICISTLLRVWVIAAKKEEYIPVCILCLTTSVGTRTIQAVWNDTVWIHYIHIYIYINIYMHIYTYTYLYSCMYIHIKEIVYSYRYINLNMSIRVRLYTYTFAYVNSKQRLTVSPIEAANICMAGWGSWYPVLLLLPLLLLLLLLLIFLFCNICLLISYVLKNRAAPGADPTAAALNPL